MHDYPVLFIKLECPLHELQRREKMRGDREIGTADWQLPLLSPRESYDLTVNTFEYTADECADQIISVLAEPGYGNAFRSIYRKAND